MPISNWERKVRERNTPSNSNAAAEAPSTRWWESYLVRYFVGFIVGSICIVVIGIDLGLLKFAVNKLITTTTSNIKPDWAALFLPLAVLGLGYCYVVSTPITVLHAGRFSRWTPEAHSRHFWFGWLLNLIASTTLGLKYFGTHSALEWLVFVVSLAIMLLLPVTSNFDGIPLPKKCISLRKSRRWFKKRPLLLLMTQSLLMAITLWCLSGRLIDSFPTRLEDKTIKLWLLGAPIFWIGLMQYSVLARLLVQTELNETYVKLFRARRQKNAKDVRDTYTHLREHSNSVFIVVVELAALAVFLAFSRTSMEISSQILDISEYGENVLIGLAVWMVPTVFMWARANSVERSFAEDPEKFLQSKNKKD